MKSGLTDNLASQFLTRLAMKIVRANMNRYATVTEQIGQDFQDILVGQPAFDAHGQAL